MLREDGFKSCREQNRFVHILHYKILCRTMPLNAREINMSLSTCGHPIHKIKNNMMESWKQIGLLILFETNQIFNSEFLQNHQRSNKNTSNQNEQKKYMYKQKYTPVVDTKHGFEMHKRNIYFVKKMNEFRKIKPSKLHISCSGKKVHLRNEKFIIINNA